MLLLSVRGMGRNDREQRTPPPAVIRAPFYMGETYTHSRKVIIPVGYLSILCVGERGGQAASARLLHPPGCSIMARLWNSTRSSSAINLQQP
jgi:hypothetical protein